MGVPILEAAFSLGEVAPSLFGRFDTARMHVAASTMRNMWPSFRGGAYSRAGTAFVGFSKQTGRSFPPRLIPFQFNINQGLALEFGNFYMRVISDGAFVTDVNGQITNITQANPAVITMPLNAIGAASATTVTGGITQSYAPLDFVTLAGGIFSTPTQLQVTTTKLLSTTILSPGGGVYAPGDTIHLTGGTQTTAAVLTVQATQVAGASIAAAGTSAGLQANTTVQGTTGTGAKFTAVVQLGGFSGGASAILSISFGGNYTVNPTVPSSEPVTDIGGGGLTGCRLNLQMGLLSVSITTAGIFTANPAGGTFTQASTSGSGSGATFKNSILGPNAVIVSVPGSYSTYPNNPVAQASTTGTGLGATFNVTTTSITGGNLSNGDWVFLSGIGGMTQLNGVTVVAQNVTGNSFSAYDVYGNPINSTGYSAYTSNGMGARIYTLATPYAEVDLPYLKVTQSADVMSLCLVNQQSLVEYVPQDLSRVTDSDFSFSPVIPAPTVLPPTNAAGSASTSGSVDYAYQVTAVDPETGSESIASNTAAVASAVDIAATAGTITITWMPSTTPNVNQYNVYKATPGYGTAPPTGALFGYAGTAYGAEFLDSNIIADFAQVPPTHQNPFARGQIDGVAVTNSTGTVTSVTFTITTSTGSGAILAGVIQNSALVAVLVIDPGQNYSPNDSVTINVVGGGSATGTLNVGPQSGTYPAVPSYFQQRRVYGYTLNQPDTYFMSQPGAFTNFDSRIPTIDSDAIIGSPWSVEVNGIQWMLNTPGGLLTFTGKSVWLLVGAGSFATNVQAISPSTQDVNPQPEIGASATLPPVKIDYDVLYVGANNSTYYDLPYQLYALSIPLDLTVNSPHLFQSYQFVSRAWCRNPFKIEWAVRNDGALLSLTWLKAEQAQGWARHDTQGSWVSNCSVTELPNDAHYLAAQRTFAEGQAYTIERMDNRQWPQAENVWAVDCGLALSQPTPSATLTASSATGLGSVTGATNIVGGAGYSAATTGQVIDAPFYPNGPMGPGAGAVPTLNIVGGVLLGVTFGGGNQGSGYLNPQLVLNDPAGSAGGSGGGATLTLNNSMTFSASAAVFANGDVGSFIRMGGGIAKITAYTDTQHVTANMLSPIVQLTGGLPGGAPLTAAPGAWTKTAPVSTVYAPHLVGATVTGLADGNVIAPQVVGANGNVTLPAPATAVVVGLGFQAQLQSVYADGGEPTMQAQRKKVAAANVLLEASRGAQMGSNQQDGSTLSPYQSAPVWNNLDSVPDLAPEPYNALCPPLATGYARVAIQGGYGKPGQVAVQQTLPLPLQVLALVPEILGGDKPESEAKPQQRKAA